MSYFNIDDVTVGEGDGQATFRITLSEPLSETASVVYNDGDGTASGYRDSDFVRFSSQTLTFQPGEVEKEVSVLLGSDTEEELTENFFVYLSEPETATIGDSVGLATILDDDGPPPSDPTVSIDPLAVAETADVAEAVLRLNGPVDEPVELDYTTVAGTADSGDDFAAREDDLTFIPGELAKTVRIPIIDDGSQEGFEDLSLALSGVTGANAERTETRLVIADDDGQQETTPTVRIGDATVGENAGAALLPIMLSAPSADPTSIVYNDSDGTASGYRGNDFERFSSRTLTFQPGETRKEVPVLISQDVEQEDNETFYVNLSDPSGLSLADNASADVTIVDDDADGSGPRYASMVGGDDRTITEGEVGSVEIPVSLTRPADRVITADISVSADSTLSADEYVLSSEELIFRPGDVAQSLTVFINDDEAFEGTETLEVTVDFSGEIEAVDTDDVTFELMLVDDEVSVTLNGSPGDDVLRPGQEGAYTIYAGGGADRVTGGASPDRLYGGPGRDFIVGGDGPDMIYAGGGADRVFAGGSDTGDDTIRGGGGADILGAGAGEDEVYGQAGNDTLFGGLGDDILEGQAGSDVAWSGAGADVVRGGDGNDTLGGGAGDDEVMGGVGRDTLYGGADQGNDMLNGGGWADTIFGGAGTDAISGGNGDDTVYNGAGTDAVRGGGGADTLWGGGGDDTLTGGGGADTFAFVRGNGSEIVTDFQQGTDGILIENGPNGFGELEIGSTDEGTTVAFADVTLTLQGIAQEELNADLFSFG